MKYLKHVLIICWLGSACVPTSAQVLCIYCYDQNDSISHGITNLIINGGFEQGCGGAGDSSFCPNSQYYTCDIPNWTCTGGGTNTYCQVFDTSGAAWYGGFLSEIIEGHRAVYFGNYFSYLCTTNPGDTSCLHGINCTAYGIPAGYPRSFQTGYGADTGISLQQTVNGLIVGGIYVLEFWAGGEYDVLNPSEGVFAVNVGFGDTLLRNKPTDTGAIGTRYVVEFRATSSSHVIKFTNWGHVCNTCTELVLDDVRLYTIAQLNPAFPHCMFNGIAEANEALAPTLYPNPTPDAATITMNNQEPSEVILFDITGRELLHESFNNSIILPLQSLAKGVYLYQIRTAAAIRNGKIIRN